MFDKKKGDDYFEGQGQGEAEAYSKIDHIIAQHINDDPKAVLLAVKIICEYELIGNPYRRLVVLHKSGPKEM